MAVRFGGDYAALFQGIIFGADHLQVDRAGVIVFVQHAQESGQVNVAATAGLVLGLARPVLVPLAVANVHVADAFDYLAQRLDRVLVGCRIRHPAPCILHPMMHPAEKNGKFMQTKARIGCTTGAMATKIHNTLGRAVRLLERCCVAPTGAGFNELLAAFPHLVPSTLSRLLKQLLREELLAKNAAGRYAPGPGLRRLAGYLAEPPRAATLLIPLIDKLAQTCQQSALYVEREDNDMVLRYKTETEGGFHYRPCEERSPLLAMGFGLPFCVFNKAAWVEQRIADHIRQHPEEEDEINEHLQALRKHGVTARRERVGSFPEGCWRIIAPVCPDHKNRIVGSLGITVFHHPKLAAELEDLKQQVKQTAQQANALLPENVQSGPC